MRRAAKLSGTRAPASIRISAANRPIRSTAESAPANERPARMAITPGIAIKGVAASNHKMSGRSNTGGPPVHGARHQQDAFTEQGQQREYHQWQHDWPHTRLRGPGSDGLGGRGPL